ncbi:hypothetical protein Q8F55_008946 [Vanrija albida]|uniref:Uncharacterized protein n=1 Tax=Vanrija albida TaxID=181172 RepID=A0ABR3PSA4_9TREE
MGREQGSVVPLTDTAAAFTLFLLALAAALAPIHLYSAAARAAAGVTWAGLPDRRGYAAAVEARTAHTFARVDGVLVAYLPPACMLELTAWLVGALALAGALGALGQRRALIAATG